jgi:hypothetical protein
MDRYASVTVSQPLSCAACSGLCGTMRRARTDSNPNSPHVQVSANRARDRLVGEWIIEPGLIDSATVSVTPRIMRPQARFQTQLVNRVDQPLPPFIAKNRTCSCKIGYALTAGRSSSWSACAWLRTTYKVRAASIRVGAIGWKESTNDQTVLDETGCRGWRSGIVGDRWGRGRVRRSRSGSDRQHNLQLSAGGGGAERGKSRSCRAIQRIAGDAVRFASVPRLAAESTPADGPAAGERARGSAVLWRYPTDRRQLQQLLSGLGTSFLLSPIPMSGPQHSVFLPKSFVWWLGRPEALKPARPLEDIGGGVWGHVVSGSIGVGPRNMLVITAVRRSPGTRRRLMPWRSSTSGTRVPRFAPPGRALPALRSQAW